VARGYGKRSQQTLIYPNYPMVRDTTVIPPIGFIVLRFVADNPGVWLRKCHTMLPVMERMLTSQ
jgi:FtsP/CotA-like multicopper oxidase with cupredoxin domain